MKCVLGLRPWWVVCVLGLAGCGSNVEAPSGPDAGRPAGPTRPGVVADDFCEPGGAPCPSGSTCRRPGGWMFAHCVADGAEYGACRTESPICDPGLGCDAQWQCVRPSTPEVDAGRRVDVGPPVDAGSPADAGQPADVAPVVDAGPPADVRRGDECGSGSGTRCPSGQSCVWRATGSTCVAAGGPGAICRSDRSCDAGFVCDWQYTNTCLPEVALGATCGAPSGLCTPGSSCRLVAAEWRCVADGAPYGRCATSGLACLDGSACSSSSTPSICVPIVAVGAACDRARSRNLCANGSSCLDDATGSARCFAVGAELGACPTPPAVCGAGLRCEASRCRRVLALGDACGNLLSDGLCPADVPCVGPSGAAHCRARGAEGGLCRVTSPRCSAGLECSSYDTGTCRRVVDDGGACDVAAQSTVCAGTSTCAPDLSGVSGVCAQPGVLAGSLCRVFSPRCDPGLECGASASSASSASTCRRVEPVGAACDVGQLTVVCAGAARCARTATAGVCTGVSAEVEPNDAVATAQALSGSAAIVTGTVAPDTLDCFALTTAARGSILVVDRPIRYDDYLGSDVTLYDDAGTELASATGATPTIDPGRTPAVRDLAPGRYVVCVRARSSYESQYELTVSAVATANP